MDVSGRAEWASFELAHPDGEGSLQISVAPPPGPPSEAQATLYVVDGDLVFGVAAELARVLMTVEVLPPLHVVGIGYGADYQAFLRRRTADLTPPPVTASPAPDAVVAALGDRNGGADAFLAFLAGDLRRAIEARHPRAANGRRILFGHSLGGLFAAHALLTGPQAFDAYIVSSPSLWWDGFSLLKALPAFAARLRSGANPPTVFVDVGGREQDLPTRIPVGFPVTLEEAQAQIRNARMVDAAGEFARALADCGLQRLRHVVFAEEDHTSVAAPAIVHGLRFAMRQDELDSADSGHP